MSVELWLQSIDFLRDELPAQHFNTWIRPLQVEAVGDELHIFRTESVCIRLGQ